MSAAVVLCIVFLLSIVSVFTSMFSSKKWSPKGQHCYVTGGTSGLGLALSILLVQEGADVSIVARNEERLQNALRELEKVRQTPNQLLKGYSFALDNAAGANEALDTLSQPHGGRVPDAVFLCAGKSTPGFWVEHDEASLQQGMADAYWVQAWTALAASKKMVEQKVQGRLIFTGSILSFMSIVGYSTYSPGKWALRGLAETLRSELLLYSINVHMFFPATIHSPGYLEENKTKPKITLKIEERDAGMLPAPLAKIMLDGVVRGNFHITPDFNTNVFRASSRGSSPYNNVVLDTIYCLIAWIAATAWRREVDATVVQHRKEHEGYLAERGWFKTRK